MWNAGGSWTVFGLESGRGVARAGAGHGRAFGFQVVVMVHRIVTLMGMPGNGKPDQEGVREGRKTHAKTASEHLAPFLSQYSEKQRDPPASRGSRFVRDNLPRL